MKDILRYNLNSTILSGEFIVNKKRVGYLIAAVGVLGVLLSLSADVVGLGKGGIQATQLLLSFEKSMSQI